MDANILLTLLILMHTGANILLRSKQIIFGE